MAHPVQAQARERVHQVDHQPQVRAPIGVAAAPTTITSRAESPQSCVGMVEGFFIRLKNLMIWLFQWIFCSKPAEEVQAQPQVVQQQPDQREQRRTVQRPEPLPGSREENFLLLLRLQQKSDLEQQHILVQIGNGVYAKSGAAGYYTYFRQTPELIGRNAVAADPQLLKPFLH